MTVYASVTLSLAIIYITLISLINPVSANGNTIHVYKGHSIQSAINSANAYDHIIVEAGTYAEQLTITEDGITLIGHNAVLVPPSSPTTNTCSGLAGLNAFTGLDTQAGICITGSNVVLAPYVTEHRKVLSVGDRIKDVSVRGFSVSGFDGLNIAIVGAKDTTVCENTLTDGATYGALTVGSKNSVIERNTVVSSPPVAPNTFLRFIGICMDDVSSVTIAHNSINGYNIGLCVQTSGADIHDNSVKNCCIGAYVDPGIDGAKLHNNEVKDTNPLCKEDASVSGAFGVWGIIIAGAKNTLLKDNRISGITDGFSQTKLPAAGVAVFDDFPGGTGDVAEGNMVIDNRIVRNDVDLQVAATGNGNVEKDNNCKVSLPAGLCK
jgi:nitrous oxidase accessory protein NosD